MGIPSTYSPLPVSFSFILKLILETSEGMYVDGIYMALVLEYRSTAGSQAGDLSECVIWVCDEKKVCVEWGVIIYHQT